MKRAIQVLLVTAGLFGAAVLAPTTAGAETVNLEQAVEQALNHDPRIEEMRQLVEVARTLVGEAEGHGGWTVDGNLFLGVAPGVKGGFFENGGCEPGNCIVRSDRYDPDGLSLWTSLKLSLIKPLYTFGKIENFADAARANVDVKRGDVHLQRAATVLEVKRAYYGYLAARDTRLLLEDVRVRIDGAVALVQEWLDAGEHDIRQADLYALQSGAALIGRYIAQAGALENVAIDGLKVLTGAGLAADLTVADKALQPVALPELNLEDLQQQALANRPEMAQVEAGLRARRALVAANKAGARPNVYAGAVGLLSYSPNRNHLDNPYISDPFNDVGLSPVVGIKWDWSEGVQSAQVTRAEAELNALIAKSAFAREGIPFQVVEQYHQVRAHNEAVISLAEASRAARRWMIASFADFEAGVDKGDKVVTALQGYVLAHTDYLRTVFDYNMHVAQLLNVTGASQ
ncbi:MAG: TolC family protein [Pseudomonadota bacterium]